MRRLIAITAMVTLPTAACTAGDEEAVEPLVIARSTQPAPEPTPSSDDGAPEPATSAPETAGNESPEGPSPPTSPSTVVPATAAATTAAPATTAAAVVPSTPPSIPDDPPAPARSAAVNDDGSVGSPASTSSGRSVDPAALVDAANLVLSTSTTVTATDTALCGVAASDQTCIAASEPPAPPIPNPGVSVGEYQRNVPVDPAARLDIYFDQSRPYREMQQICSELGGGITQRLDDGSPWAGWYYCEDVDH